MEDASEKTDGLKQHTIPLWRRIVGVALISCLCFLALWDRYVAAGVMSALQPYYSISNTMGGLMQTTYIAVFVANLLACGYLGDRFSRKRIIVANTTLAIIFSAASCFVPANMFWLFMTLRSLAAVGSSSTFCLSAPIFSDYFDAHSRNYAIMAFFTALPVGASVGISVGTALAETSFQWALLISPILNVVAVILTALLLVEPVRGTMDDGQQVDAANQNVWEDVRHILSTRTFVLITLGMVFVYFYVSANAWWISSFVGDAMDVYGDTVGHGMDTATVMSIFSLFSVLAGILGSATIIPFAERWRQGWGPLKGIQADRAPIFSAVLSVLIATPIIFLYQYIVTTDILAGVAGNFINSIFVSALPSLSVGVCMQITLPSRRAAAMAVFNVVVEILSDGPAPFIVGALSDGFRGDSTDPVVKFASLQRGLFIATGVFALGVAAFALAALTYHADIKKAQLEAKSLPQPERYEEIPGNNLEFDKF